MSNSTPVSDSGLAEKGPHVNEVRSTSSDGGLQPPFDRAAEKKLVWKLDLRVLPVIWILYLVNFIDRANIGNAKIQGMQEELNLIGQRFNIAVWVFNLGYLVAGVPAAVAFKRFGPKSLCVMMFLWGITVIGCGLVKNWGSLVACRLLEGISEAGYIAGAAYLIGTYYKKDEFLSRYVLFSTAGILAGAINGLLSSLIAKMSGTGGYAAWRWIFIIEGLITCAVSAASWFFMVPFPEQSKFLNPEEKELLLARNKADGGEVSEDECSLGRVLNDLKDWKIWVGVFMNMGVTESANSISNFQPTILKGLGYTSIGAQVHTIPVYIVGAAVSVIFGYMSDYLGRRYVFYMVGWAILAIGIIVEIVYPAQASVRYMAMFFIASGCYTAMPISIVWAAINAGKGYKRAITIGAIINFGTAGAFVSSNVFLLKETPRFRTGFSVGLGLACIGALSATIFYVGCKISNKKRDQRRAEMNEIVEGNVDMMGEKHPDLRYVL